MLARHAAVSRRALLASSAAAALVAGTGGALARSAVAGPAGLGTSRGAGVVAFHGRHQAGIATAPPARLCFAALDLTTAEVSELRALLRRWSAAAARMTAGEPPEPVTGLVRDSGEAIGLDPARLTVTIGLGPGVFDARYGLASLRPGQLRPFPDFRGDALLPARCGGDLMVQACAQDAMVAFHAVRHLVRLAAGTASVRWLQQGFQGIGVPGEGSTRNLFGQKDGTANPIPDDVDFDDLVWADRGDGPDWMVDGTFVAVRRIRMHLDRWDAAPLREQEAAVGRRKDTGGPLSGGGEADPVDLDLRDAAGRPLVTADAHVRVARTGPGMLRRGYSYDEGWDPAAGTIDAGLFFLAYVRDLDAQYVPVQHALAKRDRLSAFTTAVGSAVFAVPPGIARGGYVGESLLG